MFCESFLKSRAPAQYLCAGAGGGKICGCSFIRRVDQVSRRSKGSFKENVTLFNGFVNIFLHIKYAVNTIYYKPVRRHVLNVERKGEIRDVLSGPVPGIKKESSIRALGLSPTRVGSRPNQVRLGSIKPARTMKGGRTPRLTGFRPCGPGQCLFLAIRRPFFPR